MVKHVVWDHELKVRFFLSRPVYIPVVKWIITKLYESLVQGSSPCRGTKYNGDYGVMVAPDSVKVAARDRYPLVTPNYCSPALGVRHALIKRGDRSDWLEREGSKPSGSTKII